MGIMNKMREKTHIILIVLIVAFLATIVFEWGMDYLGMRSGGTQELGEVNGEKIDYAKFEQKVNQFAEQQRKQNGEDPDETMMGMIRDQVWEQMVKQLLMEQQIEKLGIKVTDQEIVTWIYSNPEQVLGEAGATQLKDSVTGVFDMNKYQMVLQSPENSKIVAQMEMEVKESLLSQKITSIISGTVRINEADVMQKFRDDNIFAGIRYAFLPVTLIGEDGFNPTDEEMKKYYDSHKDEFRQDESGKLRWVAFSDAATMEDSVTTEKQLRGFTKELKKFNGTDSASILFVNQNSLTKWTDSFVKPTELDPILLNYLMTAKKDSVSDVIKASDGYHVTRLLDVKDGEDIFWNARHILIFFGADTAGAKKKAEDILSQIKSGRDFTTFTSMSDDQNSKDKGGSLGWFTKGSMVKEFQDAVSSLNVGQLTGPVKSQFGYHIIQLVDKQKKTFKIAEIKTVVKASTRTKDAARKRAEDFVFVVRKSNFEEEAKKLGLKVDEITQFNKNVYMDQTGKLKGVEKFVREEKKGSVSDPIKSSVGYGVYLMVEKTPEGYQNFDAIKVQMIAPKVKLEKKLDQLKQMAADLKSKITGNDINTINGVNNTKIEKADSVSVSKPVPVIGNDYDFSNVVFKMNAGQISDPIRTQRGYYIVKIDMMTPFDQNKYNTESEKIRTELVKAKKQSIAQDWLTELKEKAKIIDNRDKFFR